MPDAALLILRAVPGPSDWAIDRLLGIAGQFDGGVGATAIAGGAAAAVVQLGLFFRPNRASS
jgi:hypothetical protein